MGTPFRKIPKHATKCTSDTQVRVEGRENFKVHALATGVRSRKKNSRNRRLPIQATPVIHQCSEQINNRKAKEGERAMMRILLHDGYNEQRMQKFEL